MTPYIVSLSYVLEEKWQVRSSGEEIARDLLQKGTDHAPTIVVEINKKRHKKGPGEPLIVVDNLL